MIRSTSRKGGPYGIAANAHNVISVGGFVQYFRVIVHYKKVVTLESEVSYHGFADFAASNDNNFHKFISILR